VDLRIRRDRSSNCRLQEIVEGLRADLPPDHQPILAGTGEVNPRVDARFGGLLRHLREALKRALDAGEWRSARYGKADLVGSEEAGKHLSPGGAENGVIGRVLRMVRRLEIRFPRGVAGGFGGGIVRARAYGGKRGPRNCTGPCAVAMRRATR